MANKKAMRKNKTQRKQRSERKQRTQRQRQHQRQRTQRRRQGGGMSAFSPAPVEYSLAADSPAKLSLEQGEEFRDLTRAYHGGAVFSGAPLTAADSATLGPAEAAAAGVTSLTKAFDQIQGLTDDGVVLPTMPGQAGQAGGRRRKGRKASHKGRKGHKGRKASRKSNKHRKTHRRRQGGGGAFAENAGTYVKDARDGMLLDNYTGAGLNREWAAVTGTNGGDYMGPSV